MAIAYFIMAHNAPEQLRRLFELIHDRRNCYLLHIDKKAPRDCHQAAAELAARHDNAHVMPARNVRWASYSVMAATLEGIQRLLALDSRWHHFWNVSGQDLPLAPQDAIIDRLAREPRANYVETFEPASRWEDAERRPRFLRLELPGLDSGFNVPKLRLNRWQRLLGDDRYWGGSSYFTLSRVFCEAMLASPRLPAYRRFFRYSYTTDEIMLPTFIMNSPWRDTVVADNLRLIDFSEGTPRPRTWTMADAPVVLASDKLFARKFDPHVDAQIIEHVEARGGRPARAA